MPAESTDVDECHRCDGARVLYTNRCQPNCSLLRHAPDCPRRVAVACPSCSRHELGEDLSG